ncbi:unnamed protein product [Medioppia subpectinata]|uniref:Uncharacterized protein n=1 Tax=Medioppia subpectinata TaxID=1979941 RepID=A0A7R9KEK6_9ACAR|nr:unnamed protein product [Medioppia subpectinata]CAG2102100.1 unnamed protein product [Medioppia subpectinata]
MLKLPLLICLVLIVTYSSTMEIFTDEVKKNAKMILCGTCKDDGVRADILKFKDCVGGHYPKESANIMGIREAHMSNPDECIELMKTELEGYARADPTGVVKVMDCFRANLNHEHLDKCH